MECTTRISDDLLWVGGNDRRLHLFENAFPIPRGISYHSYLQLDEKTVLLDTVDHAVSDVFFENVEAGLGGRALDYVIVNHMEPDHCATLAQLCSKYPETTIVLSAKAAVMVEQFFTSELKARFQIVKEGDTLQTGKHIYTFIMAPMVHWPEVMVTFDETTGTLFSADAFGSFGAMGGSLFADELNFERDWLDDARRYYANIVGKYGAPVQTLLKKVAAKDIKMICPLHGPIWRENIAWYVDKYQRWSTYTPEEEGAVIAYASIYGHTQNAAEIMARELYSAGMKNIVLHDVSVTHPSYIVSDAFRLSHMVLCAPTYNMGIFPAMETLLLDLKAHALQNRTVGIVENGSWAPAAGKLMREIVQGMKNMKMVEPMVSIRSAVKTEQVDQLRVLAQNIVNA
ncbi:MAG: FprA family A-type flavoprotein [Clostridiales bacterium]|nr:FprA family A-type flavoprotein [Clostridiales bacterium]